GASRMPLSKPCLPYAAQRLRQSRSARAVLLPAASRARSLFSDAATSAVCALSLHDALPIWKEWGFQGFIVSDYYAIAELHFRPEVRGHAVARDRKEACRMAIEAGVNIELPETDGFLRRVELGRKGVLEETQLDELVAPMLLW